MLYARDKGIPSLYGYSPSLLRKPADWDERQHVTGYWFLDRHPDWRPSPGLKHFLENGLPPVYIGFGSMSHKNPERHSRMMLQALAISGQRGVLAVGWGGLKHLSDSSNAIFVADVPHEWLFPRMAVVVHHGGAGSTAAGLRAGVPSIISPFAGDQRSWADLVVKMGAGLQTAAGSRVSAEKWQRRSTRP